MNPEEALDAARAGDRDAIEHLYRFLAGPLLAFLRSQTSSKADAEDALGETFVAVVRDVASFDGDLKAFRGWAYRIATNRAIDLARKTKRRKELPIEEAQDVPGSEDPEEAAAVTAERTAVWAAVRALPEQQRLAISLRLSGDLSLAEVAAILGKRPNAVKALQHRAMKNLANALAPYPERSFERLEDRRTDADEAEDA